MLHRLYYLLRVNDGESQLPKYEVGFPWVKSDFYPQYLRMLLVMRPDRITKGCAAMVSMDNAQPVNRGVDPPQLGIYCRDGLCLCHVMDVNFEKSTKRDDYRLLLSKNENTGLAVS